MARKTDRPAKDASGKSRDELLWLETYFIMFPSGRRPTLAQVEHALAGADPRLRLENLEADDDGMFASLLVESPEDHAAVEISYETGEAVIEQNLEWAKQLQKQIPAKQLQLLIASDARLDVAHFERVEAGALRKEPKDGEAPKAGPKKAGKPSRPHLHDEDDEAFDDEEDFVDDESADDDIDEEAAMEIFDPTCLLTVVETLSTLTRGLAFDPAAGEVV